MKLLIVADAFPPMRTSAAVHMHELALELIKQDHEVTVIIPSALSNAPLRVEYKDGFKLVCIRAPKTKDVGYVRRTIAEFLTPYLMYFRLKSNSIINHVFDGIIWYSPTIFFGPLIGKLKKNIAALHI